MSHLSPLVYLKKQIVKLIVSELEVRSRSATDTKDTKEHVRLNSWNKWRSIRDNLRNFFLSPPAEMLSFLQQLREAV